MRALCDNWGRCALRLWPVHHLSGPHPSYTRRATGACAVGSTHTAGPAAGAAQACGVSRGARTKELAGAGRGGRVSARARRGVARGEGVAQTHGGGCWQLSEAPRGGPAGAAVLGRWAGRAGSGARAGCIGGEQGCQQPGHQAVVGRAQGLRARRRAAPVRLGARVARCMGACARMGARVGAAGSCGARSSRRRAPPKAALAARQSGPGACEAGSRARVRVGAGVHAAQRQWPNIHCTPAAAPGARGCAPCRQGRGRAGPEGRA